MENFVARVATSIPVEETLGSICNLVSQLLLRA